jgi:hypothetical protein
VLTYFRKSTRKIANILKIKRAPFLILVAALLAMLVFCWCTGFNGLYGQDAHEYLRISRLIFDFFQHPDQKLALGPAAELSIGYPLLGACVRACTGDAILALQVISIAAYAGAVFLFLGLLQQLSPGARAGSRLSYAVCLFALAPMVLRAGMSSMSDALGLFLCLAACSNALAAFQTKKLKFPLLAGLFTGLACVTRLSNAPLLAPLLLALLVHLVQRKRGWSLGTYLLAFAIGLLPLLLKSDVASHSMWADWSGWNLFRRSFVTVNGTLSYFLPNILYVLFYPLLHYGFFPLLGLLFLLFKRTDLSLYSKKIIMACLAAHLLFLATVAGQNPRYFIPDYSFWLCLLFPAWDRLHAYGFYFLKWYWMRWILGLFLAIQLIDNALLLRPMLHRNALERNIAAHLKDTLRPGDVLYAFDLDIALKSYLPELRYYNLWEKQYAQFDSGAYVLFNAPKLSAQWAGKNPMLNWERLESEVRLDRVWLEMDGWSLYRIRAEQ